MSVNHGFGDEEALGEVEAVMRLAARGDGVTSSGKHVAGGAPGDVLMPDGQIRRGPHFAQPSCRHYGICGGCSLQHVDDESLTSFVSERVLNAARAQGLQPELVAPAHLSPTGARRRANLHAAMTGGRLLLGYHEERSHRLVDLVECPVLCAELVALLAPLRKMLARSLQGKTGQAGADITLSLCDQGVSCTIAGFSPEGLAAIELWTGFAEAQNLARLSFDGGYGPESLWEPNPVSVSLGEVAVSLPVGAFLQATADGEAALVMAAREWLHGVSHVVDLFAGLGSFAFALAKGGARVLAVEADGQAHLACKQAAAKAGLMMAALHRDLFRNPLMVEELDRFGGVLLDPPRAGAREQVARLAASKVARIVYISCNPSSWARDAARLVQGGYVLEELRPIGQFRYSTHVELASLFVRR